MMKRGWKIFWIVCAVCTGVGLVCCAGSFLMGMTVGKAIKVRFPHGIGLMDVAFGGDFVDDVVDDYVDGHVKDYVDGLSDNVDDISEDIDGLSDSVDDDVGGSSGDDDSDDIADDSDDSDSDDLADDDGDSQWVDALYAVEGSKRLSFKNVNAIEVDVWAGEVEVRKDSGVSEGIVVEAENVSEKLGLRCYMDGGELNVISKKKVWGVIKGKAGKIVIRVPDGAYFEDADIGIGAGRIYIEEIDAGELSVDVGAGEGTLDEFSAQEADLNCGAGTLIASGTAQETVEIDCGAGEIIYTAQGRETDYDYSIECGVGEIVCGKNTISGLGRTKEIDNGGSREMEIACGIGNVTVNFTEF